MSYATIAAIVAIELGLFAVIIIAVLERRQPEPPPELPAGLATKVRREAIVNLRTGSAVRGLLVEADERVVVLASATVLVPGASPSPADGEVIIDLNAIDFVQLP